MAGEVAVEGTGQTAQQLEHQDGQNQRVHAFFNVADFGFALAPIPHDLGVLPHIHHQPDHPLHILQLTAPQQQVLLVHGDALLLPTKLNLPVELVEMAVGLNTIEVALQERGEGWVGVVR